MARPHRSSVSARSSPRAGFAIRRVASDGGAEPLAADIDHQGLTLRELHIDGAYVPSPVVTTLESTGGAVFVKPRMHTAARAGMFSKADCRIDVRAQTLTHPAGEAEPCEPGETVQFDPVRCTVCPLRPHCIQGQRGRGRLVRMTHDEPLQKMFPRLQTTSPGRAALRERVAVEHALARIAARKGDRSRYVGDSSLAIDTLRPFPMAACAQLLRRGQAPHASGSK